MVFLGLLLHQKVEARQLKLHLMVLLVSASTTTLIFSSVGYGTKEAAITGNTVNVSLEITNATMNEVVVIGYGTRQKKDLTGSVTNITSKDFNKGTIATPEQLIAGKVAGVQIVSNGGAPGSGCTIRIRGGASLSANNSPLIVIDGVPMDFGGISGAANPYSLINPNDIESINILKDASATAIYGSRASNGVIIITTKKGKSGKPGFTFSSQYSLSTPSNHADVLSPTEFRAYVNSHGTAQQRAMLGAANTNWFDQIFRKANGTDNNLVMSGSLKWTPYRISLGYFNQEGVLKTGNLQRKSISINLGPSLFKNYLRIDLGIKSSFTNTRFANEGAIEAAANFDPTQFVHSGSKRFGGYYEWLDPNSTTGLKTLAPRNPLGLLEQRLDISDVSRHIMNALVDYKLHFFPDLHAKVNLGWDVATGEGSVYVPDSAASAYKYYQDANGVLHGGVDNHYLQRKFNTLLEPYLAYAKDIRSIKSKVDVVLGYSYQEFIARNTNGMADPNGPLTDDKGRWTPFYNYTADRVLTSAPTYRHDRDVQRLISYYGRVNFSFNDKYLVTGSLRRDGSSHFAPETRWGWFPAGAFAWRIKSEPFMENSRVFSDLKLRIGYGETGQQEFRATYLPIYNVGNTSAQYQFGGAFYPVFRPEGYNPNLKWESTATSNLGLDFGFLSNRLTGSIDVYYKKTKDLLNAITQPAGTNFTNIIIANVGNMENKGVELNLNATAVKSKRTTVDLNFNFTYNHNEITKLTLFTDSSYIGNTFGGISGGTGNTILINSVGFNRGAFYVYQQVYDENGKPVEDLFVDRNGDGQITDKDLYRYKGIDPKILMGFSSNVTWRKWFGGFLMRASIGNYMYNNRFASTGTKNTILNPLGFLSNGSSVVLKNDFVGGGSRFFLSDYFVENASFLKMDNIYVGFDAGSFLAKGTTLRLGASIQNVFMVTKYKGVDPEIPGGIDNNFYPRPRIFTISANLDF